MLQDPRLLSYALRLRYSDFDKVDKIINDINTFLDTHTGVDHKLPHKARLTDLATYSVDISITVSTACQHATEIWLLRVGVKMCSAAVRAWVRQPLCATIQVHLLCDTVNL